MTGLTLQPFLNRYPPSRVQRADPELLRAYRRVLSESLLDVWEQVGLGQYADGLLTLIDPRQYAATLQGWLMRDSPDPDRVPLALSAFGTLLYYRRLSGRDEDVAYIDTVYSASAVVAWSLDACFNEVLCSEGGAEALLAPELFSECRELHGPLQPGQIYAYVPALSLGGSADARHAQPSDALVHLDMLLQLAQG